MALNQLAFIGDSLTDGAAATPHCTYGAGGKGSWVQLLRDRLANLRGLGPLVSTGLIPCGSEVATGDSDWSFTTGGDAWTSTVSTDAWDRSPYGSVGGVGTLRYANGATKIATFTVSANVNMPNVGFTLYCVDYTTGGNWSYSTDGGTVWNASGVTTTANKIVKFHVATPLTAGSTVKIRGANAAGTGVGCAPLGIEVFYQTPTTASGLIVHNLACMGSALHQLTAATSGDRLAWFKSAQITIGTNAISHLPNLGTIVMHINDVADVNNTTTWATDLTTFNTAVSGLGPLGIMNPHECATATYNATTQANYRSQTTTTGGGFSSPAKIFDLFNQFNNLGFGSSAAVQTAGYTFDGTHETQQGHFQFAEWIYWFVRQKILA